MPIDRNIYFCDKRFHTESIEGLFADSNSVPKYLLAVIGGEEVEIWIKQGTKMDRLKNLSCHRQKSQRKGGQSAHRFQMIRLEQIAQWTKKIAEEIGQQIDNHQVQGAIMGGTGDIPQQVYGALQSREKFVSPPVTLPELSVRLLTEKLSQFEDKLQNPVYEKYRDEIEALIAINPDALLFGREALDALTDHGVKTLYTTAGMFPETASAEIIAVTQPGSFKDFLEKYGGSIGIRWY